MRVQCETYMLRPAQSMTMLTMLRGSQERKETRTMLMRRKRVFWLRRSPSASDLLQSGSWESFRYILTGHDYPIILYLYPRLSDGYGL